MSTATSVRVRDGKRLGKQLAVNRWNRLAPEERTLVLIAVRNYAGSDGALKGIGIKDPHRWLAGPKGSEPWREWLTPSAPKGTTNGHNNRPFGGFAEQDYDDGAF